MFLNKWNSTEYIYSPFNLNLGRCDPKLCFEDGYCANKLTQGLKRWLCYSRSKTVHVYYTLYRQNSLHARDNGHKIKLKDQKWPLIRGWGPLKGQFCIAEYVYQMSEPGVPLVLSRITILKTHLSASWWPHVLRDLENYHNSYKLCNTLEPVVAFMLLVV